MPADYQKPVYVTNKDKYQSNADKYRQAEKNDKPRQRPTDTDHTRTPQPKKAG
jgi:hypothetical protein